MTGEGRQWASMIAEVRRVAFRRVQARCDDHGGMMMMVVVVMVERRQNEGGVDN